MPRPRVRFGVSFPNFFFDAAAKIAREGGERLDSVWVNDDLVGAF